MSMTAIDRETLSGVVGGETKQEALQREYDLAGSLGDKGYAMLGYKLGIPERDYAKWKAGLETSAAGRTLAGAKKSIGR